MTRDEQVKFMAEAEDRHAARVERLLKDERFREILRSYDGEAKRAEGVFGE